MNIKMPYGLCRKIWRRPCTRELVICLAFLALTALMTWPWVTRLRDAVADPGDPYMIAWTLWWDYHQTFHDPLNLFQANIFYPYHYTLAFSEHDYGISLLFFPLFALGLRPLTVHSIATFTGFVFSGYGAFRLARTLTGSHGAAWVAGVVFAFIPFRFHLLAHLHYMFAGWMPLVLEALVLFARERSWRRASWLGLAFLMNALTCISWAIMTAIPLTLSGLFLLTRRGLWRDRRFWLRGAAALSLALLALAPFLWPYVQVNRLYGLIFSVEETKFYSALPHHWLVAENRNKLWDGFGASIERSQVIKLFPGLLPLLFTLAAFLLVEPQDRDRGPTRGPTRGRAALLSLDALAIVSGVVALIGAGYDSLHLFGMEMAGVTARTIALSVLTVSFTARCCLAYPQLFRAARERSLLASICSERFSEAFGLGLIWAATGFLTTLGFNTFFFRLFHDFIPLFRTIRLPTRGAMVCYVGLALLAGLGAERLVLLIKRHAPRLKRAPRSQTAWLYALIVACFLFELRAAPLKFNRGEVFPDEVTLRLKETPMRGGLVELPAGRDLVNHRYMLRAADHGRPIVVAHSSFYSPLARQVEQMTNNGPITDDFMDLLESIPASYLVIHNTSLKPDQRRQIELFIYRQVSTGRLRLIRSFDEQRHDGPNDLYAVVKTEPTAQSEVPSPSGPQSAGAGP